VAHGRRLQAAVLLFQTVEGEVTALPFSSVCLPLLSFSVVSLYPPGLLSSFLPRFQLFLPLRLSLSVVPFLFGSFSLLGSFSVSLRFLSVRSPPPPASCVGVEPLFIEPKEWGSLLSRMGQGSAGRLASGRRWQGMLPLISHHQGAWGFESFAEHASRWK